jgi:hypothetical protein
MPTWWETQSPTSVLLEFVSLGAVSPPTMVVEDGVEAVDVVGVGVLVGTGTPKLAAQSCMVCPCGTSLVSRSNTYMEMKHCPKAEKH